MKYEVFINGGFANIPKHYEGELTLKEAEKKELFKALVKKTRPSNEIRDGFSYHITIIEGSTELKSVFDEHNLPNSIQQFLNEVTGK